MSNIVSIYTKICGYTEASHPDVTSSNAQLFWEEPDTIEEDIRFYPIEKLMKIQENERFIHECFFKILNRMPNSYEIDLYGRMLNSGAGKRRIIEKIYSSVERERLGTGLQWQD